MEALGRRFLAIVDARNQVVCVFNDALNESPSDLPLLQGIATDLAEAERTAADALRELTFPEDIQELIDEFIANKAAHEAALLAYAAAADFAAANAELERAIEVSAHGSELSNLLRGEMGLPSVPAGMCG